jgi:vacuolar-type H+-ATPase subunit H
MVEEIINSIIEAENKAEEIKKHAVIEARELVAKVEEKAENIRKTAEKECKIRFKESMAKALESVEKDALIIIEAGKDKAEQIKKEAEKNIEKATDKILQELFN